MVKNALGTDLPLIGKPSPQQVAVDQIVQQTKAVVLEMVKETSKEFEARELTEDQKRMYNDFIGSFTEKVILLRLLVD